MAPGRAVRDPGYAPTAGVAGQASVLLRALQGRSLPSNKFRELVAMDWKPYITSDPNIMHGAVCFRGTRVPVSVVLDNLAAGETAERILEQYPSLCAEHIPAALGYAADLARERIVPIPA